MLHNSQVSIEDGVCPVASSSAQRSGGDEDDFAPHRSLQKLLSSFKGYLHYAKPLEFFYYLFLNILFWLIWVWIAASASPTVDIHKVIVATLYFCSFSSDIKYGERYWVLIWKAFERLLINQMWDL